MENTAPNFVASGGFAAEDFGSYAVASGLAIQPNGRLIIAGQSGADFAIARFFPDGSLDGTFGTSGLVTTDFAGGGDNAVGLTLQSDGKIVVAGAAYVAGFDYAVARYNADGSLDTTFGGGDGLVTTDLGTSIDIAKSVTLQSDGKIVVAGFSNRPGGTVDLALVRYNTDGSLDNSFAAGGIVLTDIGGDTDIAYGVVQLADGWLLAAGQAGTDFALVRYKNDGSLDTTFGTDGVVETDFGGIEYAYTLAQQPDGKVLVAGTSGIPLLNDSDFVIARYNIDGSLDSSFGSDGMVATDIASSQDEAYAITLQPDGKILLAGYNYNVPDADYALVRYLPDGALDSTFGGGDGITTAAIGNYYDAAVGVEVLGDGTIFVAGTSIFDGSDNFVRLRFDSGGVPDATFNQIDAQDNSTVFRQGDLPLLLNSEVRVIDSELSGLKGGAGDYAGASLTLQRIGVASPEDVFSVVGGAGGLTLSGDRLLSGGFEFARFVQAAGILTISFTSAETAATSALVNASLQAVAYENMSPIAPVAVQISWIFNDGNDGSQGTGGALTDSVLTDVSVLPPLPRHGDDFANVLIGTVFADTLYGMGGDDRIYGLEGNDLLVGGDAIDYILGGANDDRIFGGDGDEIWLGGDDGADYITGGPGNDRIDGGDDNDIWLGGDAGGDYVTGGPGNDRIDGGDGNDIWLGGDDDADYITGGVGNDRIDGGNGNDHWLGGDAGEDYITGGAGNDRIDGGADSDRWLGGDAGEDYITGGSGNDRIEGGADSDRWLGGDDGADYITGGMGDDRIDGGADNDVLLGNEGSDVLTGGTGSDTFVFVALTDGRDLIGDWTAGEDRLRFYASELGGGLTAGALDANRLASGAAPVATEAFGQFLFDSSTGVLSWDGDGTGAGAAVDLAILYVPLFGAHATTLAAADFIVYA